MTTRLHGLSWCETIAANGRYHLRRLSAVGHRFNGGADTPTLCGLTPAWDVRYPVTETTIRAKPHYGWPCSGCVAALDEEGEGQ